jgi:hypothetical protein
LPNNGDNYAVTKLVLNFLTNTEGLIEKGDVDNNIIDKGLVNNALRDMKPKDGEDY